MKYISFLQRVTSTPVINCGKLKHEHSRLTPIQVLDNGGRIRNKTEMKTVDRVSEMSVYHYHDFSLENLIAIGAELSPSSLSMSNLEKTIQIENNLPKLD